MKTFNLITAFPESVASYVTQSILGRAQKKGLIAIRAYNLRAYAADKHKTIDDTPYGGGPGMVLKVEPMYRCLTRLGFIPKKKTNRTILLSPRGKLFTQQDANRLLWYRSLTFICGRYEGVDERVKKHLADEMLSIGNYILSGGELPALIITEAVARLIPGVVGRSESVLKSDYPSYTKPECFYPQKKSKKCWKVPAVLLSGNHKKIASWRKKHTVSF
jgi:tRNA (guanine37-N1)-methyltransferase